MIQFAPADAPRTDAPPPTYSLEDIQARRKLAEEMLRQGMDASPVQHWTQGLARVAAALSGRMSLDQAAGQSAGLQKDANDTLLNLYKPSVTGAPMPAPPPAALSKTMADAPLNEDQQGVANFASGMGTQGLAQAMPGKVASALDPSLVGAVKNFEGYAPKASWDYKQNSNGYGTRAAAPGETIDRNTAEQRLNSELGKAQGLVGAFAPNAPEGFKKALTSLTYNAGPKWMDSGLGQAVQQGDWQKASELFQQYNKAGGQTNPGLVNRRQQEAQMWLNPAAPQTPQQPAPQPTQVADGSQGQGMTRDTLARMLANPLTRDAAQKLILDQQKPRNENEYGLNPVFGQDANGNAVIMQMSKHGGVSKPALPPGVTISRTPIKIDTGQGTMLFDPITRQPIQNIPKDIAGAASAKEQGDAQGKAAFSLPLVENASQRMLDQIDKVIEDPGLSKVTGTVYGRMPTITNVTGAAKTAQSRIDQILGGTFLQAYNDLRGAGQISNAEGQSAKAAYGRLQSQDLDTPAYKDALMEFKNEILKLREIARQRAKGGQAGQATAPASNPRSKIHDLGDGYQVEFH